MRLLVSRRLEDDYASVMEDAQVVEYIQLLAQSTDKSEECVMKDLEQWLVNEGKLIENA